MSGDGIGKFKFRVAFASFSKGISLGFLRGFLEFLIRFVYLTLLIEVKKNINEFIEIHLNFEEIAELIYL